MLAATGDRYPRMANYESKPMGFGQFVSAVVILIALMSLRVGQRTPRAVQSANELTLPLQRSYDWALIPLVTGFHGRLRSAVRMEGINHGVRRRGASQSV